MNVYFDTEFTGLVPDTSLISIGMIDEEGCKFYAEFTDYNKKLCNEWIEEHVIANLIFKGAFARGQQNTNYFEDDLKAAGIEDDDPRNMFVRGSSHYIRDKLRIWLEEIREPVQLVSDVCHYDMTLLCNLFGGAFDLPKNVNPVCYDICQDIANGCGIWNLETHNHAKIMRNGFDFSREEFCEDVLGLKLPTGSKHNALYDAEVIKLIYEKLKR